MSTQATLRNMRIHDAGRVPGHENVIAYSLLTGEEYSATPGDYWHLSQDEPLLDSEGEPMILVTRRRIFEEV